MIKAILFDFDGVLTTDKTGSQSIINYLSAKTGIPFETLKLAYASFNKNLLYHGLKHEDMWQDFCDRIGTNIDYALLTDSFWNTPIDNDMIALAKRLKSRYAIGMITDNKCDRIDAIVQYHEWGELFDVISVSAAFRSGKTDERIFTETLCTLNVRPEESVFIDNTAKNLIVPEQLGMHTILFDDVNRDIQQFTEQLNRVFDK